MEKVFYFGYGHKNFGYDKELGHNLEVSFDEIEGSGIAIIRHKHIDEFPTQFDLTITNNSENETTVRIEKKFPYEVKTEFKKLAPNSNENVTVSFDEEELKHIKELVVAILKVDNTEIDNASISLAIN